MSAKKTFSRYNTKVLLQNVVVLSLGLSWQILSTCIQKFKLRIILQLFLQMISMHICSPGGLMETPLMKILKLIIFSPHSVWQVISEPTNFEPNKNPSCIDLIITNQSNLSLDCGTQASLSILCHQQIIHFKVNFRIPSPSIWKKYLVF